MDFEAALRSGGSRVTRARRVVWDVLDEAGEHLSAPVIVERVQSIDPGVNPSSVYRTLTLFAEIGLVRESRLDDSTTWEPFHEDAEIHLVCDSCTGVRHFDTAIVKELRRAIDENAEFRPDMIDIRVTGTCNDCL